jgi:2,5-dioxopentanoate dehydrogenase
MISKINTAVQESWNAFTEYKKLSLSKRSEFLKTIALEIELLGDELINTCMQETNLTEARLKGERARTIFQLNSYADACENGSWIAASIDTAIPTKTPPKPDIRKAMVPLGPVVVFGASNFPFAYSTAGGDTASAFAAGCSVIVRAHFAHSKTSALMASAIDNAITKCNLPKGLFLHITEEGNEIGKELVMHPSVKAVGFTGSLVGGKAIWNYANQRNEPIPVFAEMSSINPVFLFPEKLKIDAEVVAKQLAGSITLGAGQFCTNPGLLIAIDDEHTQKFQNALAQEIKSIAPAAMLHDGIAKNYREKKDLLLQQSNVQLIAQSDTATSAEKDIPTIATTSGAAFLQNKNLHSEVFGSFSLIVLCKDENELLQVAIALEGQLTATLMATNDEIEANETLIDEIKNHCGRIIANNVPTGVEVCPSMQHGGPWPASTDSRFTSVGADAISRFVRPLSFQNYPNHLLPDVLKNDNPLNIWRTVNGVFTKDSISN